MPGVYIDTGLFVALTFNDDDNHERARELFEGAIQGTFGKPLHISIPVIVETAAMVHRKSRGRTKRADACERVHQILRVIETYKIKIHFVNEQWKQLGIQIYLERNGQLDFVDSINVAFMRLNNCSNIISFDSDYDQFNNEGIVRIC